MNRITQESNNHTNVNYYNLLNYIINFYGKRNQIEKLQEEFLEFGLANHRYWYDEPNKFSEKAFKDELADLEVMLDQVKIMAGIDFAEISKIKSEKVQRTIERIQNAIG